MWHGVTMNSDAWRDNNQKWCPCHIAVAAVAAIRCLPISTAATRTHFFRFFPLSSHTFWPKISTMSDGDRKRTQRWMIYCVFVYCAGVKMASHKYALMCFTNFTNYLRMIYTAMSSRERGKLTAKSILFSSSFAMMVRSGGLRNTSSFLPTNKHANKQIKQIVCERGSWEKKRHVLHNEKAWIKSDPIRENSQRYTKLYICIPKEFWVCVCVRVNFGLKNETVNFSRKPSQYFIHSRYIRVIRIYIVVPADSDVIKSLSAYPNQQQNSKQHSTIHIKKRSHNNRSRRTLRHSVEAFASINTSDVHAYVRIQTSV